MKIVKQHKNRSVHSEAFGIFSGKTLAEVDASNCSHGGTWIELNTSRSVTVVMMHSFGLMTLMRRCLPTNIEFWAESRRRECRDD